MGNTIIIGGPSFGFPFLGASSFGGGSGFASNPLSGFGSSGIFGGQSCCGSANNIPGLQNAMTRLGLDALTGNLGGVLQGIANLGSVLSNALNGNQNGNGIGNASSFQPLPASFSPNSEGCQNCGSSEQNDLDSREDRINQLLRRMLQMFGPMMQMFSQLLGLMLDQNGGNRSLQGGLTNNFFNIRV
jgi:hypothetical protein